VGNGTLVEAEEVELLSLEVEKAALVAEAAVVEHAGVVEPEAVGVAADHAISGAEVTSIDHPPPRTQLFG
jgi:hypothetical protein